MTQNAQENRAANVIFAEGTGSLLVLLEVARQQAFFAKRDLDLRTVPARGANVPRLSQDTPLGLIGAPAALLQVAEGADLRVIATLSTTNLSGHLVAQPGIQTAQDLRGRRLGVRVVGAGIWISTVLALEQLGLDAKRDGIALVPIGSPAQILRALEEGVIDAALVTAAQSRDLAAKAFTVLLRDYPKDITSFDCVLAARPDFLSSHADIVEDLIAGLMEALAFCLAGPNSPAVMRAFDNYLGIVDPQTAADSLRELHRKPNPLIYTLQRMQRIIGSHDPRAFNIPLERLINDRWVRKLDENGTIDRLHADYGIPPIAKRLPPSFA
jgi:ABC-type nitrate/sulfonate/bicarbonate transport system substrate-binding protein